MSKPLRSTNVVTDNVVLKVTVPKRTGRKRKKGSLGPYAETLEEGIDTHSSRVKVQPGVGRETTALVRAMRDNPTKYEIEGIGAITHTHRFRGKF